MPEICEMREMCEMMLIVVVVRLVMGKARLGKNWTWSVGDDDTSYRFRAAR